MKNNSYLSSKIASGLAELRKSRKVTQEELAKRIGTKQETISQIERGAAIPSWEFINRIAKALNAEVDISFTLLDNSEISTPVHPSHDREYICVNCLHRWESPLKQTVLQCPRCHKRQGVLYSEYIEMLEAFQKVQQAVQEAPPPRKAPPVKSLIKNIPPMLKMVLEGAEKTFPSPRLPVSLLFRILEQSKKKQPESSQVDNSKSDSLPIDK
jgi:transcriptional regulator with XRE-family HTH domain